VVVVTTARLLALAAFGLSLIAMIVSVTLRRRVAVLEEGEIRRTGPIDATMDGPQIFAAAVAASQKARRARLSRQERIRGILGPVAFGLSGLIAMFALAALFLADDRKAATVCAWMATLSFGFTITAYLSAKRAREKAAHSALGVDQSL
jgi:hypothetical protein